jgi:hypothetical protein
MATRYNYTGGIVTNGLVLNLDAAKTDSYPGTGTTWRDISGNNNNGTLTNGPTFSGIGKQASIVFDGVDDYAFFNTDLRSLTSITINVWLKPIDPSLSGPPINSQIFAYPTESPSHVLFDKSKFSKTSSKKGIDLFLQSLQAAFNLFSSLLKSIARSPDNSGNILIILESGSVNQ